MADPQEVLAERVGAAVAAAFGASHAGADPLIRPSQFADFQANVALSLGKSLGMPPRQVADQIVAHLDVTGICDRVEVSGPGFINLTLASDWIAGQASGLLADQRLGVALVDPGLKVVVDYSGPNVAKELHVGHLRATAVGDAVVRILEFLGQTVIRAAHLGDWGTPFGMLIEYTLEAGEEASHAALAAGDFTAFYQAARTRFDADEAFAERARRRVATLQAGDPESLRLWQVLVNASMEYLRMIYARLNITLTDADMDPESFYNPMLADVCAELEDAGIAVISEGALCAFPPGFTGRDGKPLPLILRKSDGGYGYATTDTAAIRYRLLDLKATRLIYVVGSEQAQHLQMVFAVARQAGLADRRRQRRARGDRPGDRHRREAAEDQGRRADQADHADRRGGRAGRPGDRRPLRRPGDSGTRSPTRWASARSSTRDLSVARESSYTFDFDRMLALTGNTGPYLQYATARIRSIFRKAGLDPAGAAGPVQITAETERALALTLLGFGRAVQQSAQSAEPHHLAGFLFDLASAFTAFYEACPVLQAGDPEVRESRLALCALVLRVLVTGLGLLGIPVPERM